MKRIALFISSFQKGGSERVMAGLAVYFHEQKYDVILVTQYKKETEYNLPPEIRRVYSEPDESLLTGGENQEFLGQIQGASGYLESIQTRCNPVISGQK